MALTKLNGRWFNEYEVLKEKQVNRAIGIIKKYEKLAQGDEVGKCFIGTIPWYERELLDDYFLQYRHDDGYWVVHFKTGNYRSNQNDVVISFHISNKRMVRDLMLNAGFLPKEIEAYLEEYTGENLVALGKAVENGLFKPENIKF